MQQPWDYCLDILPSCFDFIVSRCVEITTGLQVVYFRVVTESGLPQVGKRSAKNNSSRSGNFSFSQGKLK